jgi:hypothetical protein
MKPDLWQARDASEPPRSRLISDPCIEQNAGRRRVFWTTQHRACGDYFLCGHECSLPGLKYIDNDETVEDGRTIMNSDWLLSLILNILNTRARTDKRCSSPAAIYGHWSESYRDDQLYIGTRLWNAAERNYVRMADAVKAIRAAIQSDMSKLVALGVADSVEVEATYSGRNGVEVTVIAVKVGARHALNLSGTFVSDTWIWN